MHNEVFGGSLLLDTNVLVSALILGGGFAWLYEAWQKERIRPLASRATVSELIRVLAYPKFRLSAEERETLLAEYLPWCESVVVPDSTRVPDCRDPADIVFLQLAVAGRADALVTGDRDLLALDGGIPAPILSPAAIKERLRGKRASR